MNKAKSNNEEIIELIFYGLKENNIDSKDISALKIKSIINQFLRLCNEFKKFGVIGELDTFKKAACLLVAINQGELSQDKRVNAAIALDVAYKMCEKPYWNVGINFDTPQKLEEVNFKECFENHMYAYNKSKNMLIDSLVYENGNPINYHINLELTYHLALEIKHHQSTTEPISETPIQTNDDTDIEKNSIGQNMVKKFGSIFRKKKNNATSTTK